MTVRYVPPRVPLIDLRTGLINSTWYLFFQGLMDPTSNSDEDALALLTPPSSALAVSDTDGEGLGSILAQNASLLMSESEDLAPPCPAAEAVDDLWNAPVQLPDAATRQSLGAAASGANSDITSLSGLTTALSIGQGGTGRSTAVPILIASRSTINLAALTYTTIPCTTVTIDSASAYNTGTGIYTVPETGYYLVNAIVRAPDSNSGLTFGVGIDTAGAGAADTFSWFSEGNNPGAGTGIPKGNGMFTKIVAATAADQLRLYMFNDSGVTKTFTALSLQIVKVR